MIRESTFRALRGCSNRHLQTILPALGLVPTPTPATQREILPLPDGDSLALDWLEQASAEDAPLLLILHGLEGSSESSYARCLLALAESRGWRGVVMHFRDCGDHRNRLKRRYHAGETGDIAFVADALMARYPAAPLLCAGFSLGGNVLLKYLGENGENARCHAAVAVSVPFVLQEASDSISSGFSKLYQWHLMKNMKRALRKKFTRRDAPFNYDQALGAKTFEEFDNLVTAPLHGFSDKDEYYNSASSRQFLIDIARPTLVLHAVDDPFMTTTMIPEPHELAEPVQLELSANGGHVGFIAGERWRERHYWLPLRIGQYFDEMLVARDISAQTRQGQPNVSLTAR